MGSSNPPFHASKYNSFLIKDFFTPGSQISPVLCLPFFSVVVLEQRLAFFFIL
jgi:hypothetical protein